MEEHREGVAFPPRVMGAAEGQMVRADLVREIVARRERGGRKWQGWRSGEGAVPLACFVRRRNRLKRRFDLVFRGGMVRGKAENRSGRRNVLFQLSRKREGQDQQRKK